MTDEIVDLIQSLTALMEEESDRLVAGGRVPDLREMAEAKTRLVGQLEARLAQLNREQPGWPEALAREESERLAASIAVLRDAAALNAEVLERQIELSNELMSAIAEEAQRLMGTRQATYGANGDVFKLDLSTPISLNTRL